MYLLATLNIRRINFTSKRATRNAARKWTSSHGIIEKDRKYNSRLNVRGISECEGRL